MSKIVTPRVACCGSSSCLLTVTDGQTAGSGVSRRIFRVTRGSEIARTEGQPPFLLLLFQLRLNEGVVYVNSRGHVEVCKASDRVPAGQVSSNEREDTRPLGTQRF
jgi:hypothetical protein